MNTLFGMSDIFQLYNEYINVPDSPFGGNYKGHAVKSGENQNDEKTKITWKINHYSNPNIFILVNIVGLLYYQQLFGLI